MQRDVQERYADALRARAVSHALLAAMQRATKGALGKCAAREFAAAT